MGGGKVLDGRVSHGRGRGGVYTGETVEKRQPKYESGFPQPIRIGDLHVGETTEILSAYDKATATTHHKERLRATLADASNIVAYTDGSSGENGDKIMSAGAGIYSEKAGISESLALGEGMGVYDAELEGIYQTTQRICGQRRFRKKNITIFSDNQAAVRWARQLGPGQGQRLSRKLHDIAIRQRQHGGSLQVECVPGHCEVDGNERADALAKAGVNNVPDPPSEKRP
jgi:ribonuclease HI